MADLVFLVVLVGAFGWALSRERRRRAVWRPSAESMRRVAECQAAMEEAITGIAGVVAHPRWVVTVNRPPVYGFEQLVLGPYRGGAVALGEVLRRGALNVDELDAAAQRMRAALVPAMAGPTSPPIGDVADDVPSGCWRTVEPDGEYEACDAEVVDDELGLCRRHRDDLRTGVTADG